MNATEMGELLREVKKEHSGFDLNAERGHLWYAKFKHLNSKQFARLCQSVLEVCRFTPTYSDFCKAHKDLFGNASKAVPHDPDFTDAYHRWNVEAGNYPVREQTPEGRTTVRYELDTGLELILEAFGVAWFNSQLGIHGAVDCWSVIRRISNDRSFNARYMAWRKLARDAAYKTLNGEKAMPPQFSDVQSNTNVNAESR